MVTNAQRDFRHLAPASVVAFLGIHGPLGCGRAHCLLEEPADAVQINARHARLYFVAYIHDGVLKGRFFRKYLGRKKALALSRIVEDYRKEHEDRMRRAKGEVS